MCLITTQKLPKIAKEDIKIFKVLSVDRISFYYNNFFYAKDKLYTTTLQYTEHYRATNALDVIWLNGNFPGWKYGRPDLTYIGEGFHGFTELNKFKDLYNMPYHSFFHTTIPAESEYYENEVGMIVSNQIIVHDRV